MTKTITEKNIQKQTTNKFDDKSRKEKEAKGSRITLRCTDETKKVFQNICQKTGKSQSDVFEEYVAKKEVVIVPFAKEAAMGIVEVFDNIKTMYNYLEHGHIEECKTILEKQAALSEALKNKLFNELEGGK